LLYLRSLNTGGVNGGVGELGVGRDSS
jgi:hypothetical protein